MKNIIMTDVYIIDEDKLGIDNNNGELLLKNKAIIYLDKISLVYDVELVIVNNDVTNRIKCINVSMDNGENVYIDMSLEDFYFLISNDTNDYSNLDNNNSYTDDKNF